MSFGKRTHQQEYIYYQTDQVLQEAVPMQQNMHGLFGQNTLSNGQQEYILFLCQPKNKKTQQREALEKPLLSMMNKCT